MAIPTGPVLVSGATGRLGRPSVAALRAAGLSVRALSRRPGEGRVVADIMRGTGLANAIEGVHTVVNLATTSRHDVTLTGRLLAAARDAGVRHLVHLSIVGIDQVPLPYYRDKLQAEHLIEAAQIPYTILRATQFHETVASIFAAQRRSPVLLVPDIPIQPIDVSEVAARIRELTVATPAGRVGDIGGPEQRSARSLALAWQDEMGSRKPALHLRLPGKTFAAYAAGRHLVAGAPYGTVTFEEYLAAPGSQSR